MRVGFSLYLDALRFLAAMAVVLSHLAYDRFSGGVLQPLRELDIGRDAVVLFFVLSGLVITFAAERDGSLRRFAFNRGTRLYSVLLPALLLTLAFDAVGHLADPAAYQGWWYAGLPVADFLLRGLTFSNEWFGDPVRLGTNGPLWSLSYEACYYALFAIAFYLSGLRRVVLLIVVASLAGPRVLLLLPAWVCGVFVWLAVKHRANVPQLSGRSRCMVRIALFPLAYIAAHATDLVAKLDLLSSALVDYVSPGYALGFSANFLWYSVLATCFAIHLTGMHDLLKGRVSERIAQAVRWLAGASFTLYVLHYPTLQLLHAVLPEVLPYRELVLLAGTLVACFAVAEVCERRVGLLRNRCMLWGDRARSALVSGWLLRSRGSST